MEGRNAIRRGVIATAAAGLLVLPMSCTGDEPFDAARPLLPTTAPSSDLDASDPVPTVEPEPEPEPEPEQPAEESQGQGVDATPDTEAVGSEVVTSGDDDAEDRADIDVSTPVESTDDEVTTAAGPAEPSPPTAAPPSNNFANRPAAATADEGSGGGTTLSGPDLIASQPPLPEAPTPPPPTPPPTSPPGANVPAPPGTTVEASPTPPTTVEASPTPPVPPVGGLPPTCFGITIDECTGEVVPEGAVTQMGEYQTNVHVPVGKAVDIYFDQTRSVDEMSHLCDSMGGTFRQRVPDGSRWSGWWFCDDVAP